jgi:nucleoid-associated protein YgaU
MDVYIKTDEETFHFPVNPFSISINGGKKYDTFDILYKGERDFPAKKAKKIKTMTLDTMFPFEYEPYCRYKNIPSPDEAVRKIMSWCESEAMVRLIITDYSFNETVNISDYQVSESGQNQRDKYITLDIRVVNEDGTSSTTTIEGITAKSPAPKLKETRPKPKQPKVYIVKKGDSLWKISKKIYGSGSNHNDIYVANKDTIGNNPGAIYPGQKLIIPV